MSVRELWNCWTDLHKILFAVRSPVAVALSSTGGVAILYVLPVLWMTSRSAVVGHTAIRGAALRYQGRSPMSTNALICVCNVLVVISCYEIDSFIRH